MPRSVEELLGEAVARGEAALARQCLAVSPESASSIDGLLVTAAKNRDAATLACLLEYELTHYNVIERARLLLT